MEVKSVTVCLMHILPRKCTHQSKQNQRFTYLFSMIWVLQFLQIVILIADKLLI